MIDMSHCAKLEHLFDIGKSFYNNIVYKGYTMHISQETKDKFAIMSFLEDFENLLAIDSQCLVVFLD
jgi:hypothetical protein